MAYELIKSMSQGKFLGDKGYSSGGVCYYISEYVREKVWCRPGAGSYDKAVEIAKSIVPLTIIKAGKAKNLAQRGGLAVAQKAYPTLNTPFKINSLYRVGLWFGEPGEKPTNASHQNHEAILVTGTGAKVLFLEPNWGFYESDADTVSATNKDAFEAAVKDLYDGGNGTYHVDNFHYKFARSL